MNRLLLRDIHMNRLLLRDIHMNRLLAFSAVVSWQGATCDTRHWWPARLPAWGRHMAEDAVLLLLRRTPLLRGAVLMLCLLVVVSHWRWTEEASRLRRTRGCVRATRLLTLPSIQQ